MDILHRDDLPEGGFAGLREHPLVMDPKLFGGHANPGTRPGLGRFVYLADARFLPKGDTRMHDHREIDVVSVVENGPHFLVLGGKHTSVSKISPRLGSTPVVVPPVVLGRPAKSGPASDRRARRFPPDSSAGGRVRRTPAPPTPPDPAGPRGQDSREVLFIRGGNGCPSLDGPRRSRRPAQRHRPPHDGTFHRSGESATWIEFPILRHSLDAGRSTLLQSWTALRLGPVAHDSSRMASLRRGRPASDM